MTESTGGKVGASAGGLPSAEQVAALYESLSNWKRWGADDELGTLNLLDEQCRADAAALVRSGTVVSMAHDLTTSTEHGATPQVEHLMLACGEDLGSSGIPGYEATRDHIGTDVHGLGVTHLDALCHMFVDGRMFNDVGADAVTRSGAQRNDVMPAADGIVGRGVLLDVPAAAGIDFVPVDASIGISDLESAERRQDVTVRRGDLLVISTGRDARTDALGGSLDPISDGLAGLHPECLQWLRDREVALLASDGISDPMPPGPIERWPFPIHQVAITSMGLMLVDNMRLAALSAECERLSRWEFLMHVIPLRLPGATGCPVNPVALF